jgi:riboflavin synthase
MNGRLDGHIVQGHVDQTATCIAVTEQNGSWIYSFKYDAALGNITVEKGSICVNGISLTVFDSKIDGFSVAIIPYTYEHTNLKQVKAGDIVNLEFDIIGKYVARLMQHS